MTEQEIRALGPAFGRYLESFRGCFLQTRTMGHFSTFCRALLSDLPRKSVEPIALESGEAVRTLQQFLATGKWDHEGSRRVFHERMGEVLARLPDDGVGTIGVIDETSSPKWGDQTPGVQRQYLGCVGKIDNGIVTVHVAVAKGPFQALLDADLYLPASWANDRDRCRKAGIPDEVVYHPKWRIAFDQLMRLHAAGIRFDWLTFDEWYGGKPPFLWLLTMAGQRFVAEVPRSTSVRRKAAGPVEAVDQRQPGRTTASWERYRIPRKTQADVIWRAKSVRVWFNDGWHRLVTAVCESTGEVKYFLTNDLDAPLPTVLRVAFRRATVEHGFRLAKQEAGLMHFEGRHYVGLVRHLILGLIVMGFVAEHTERLRGEKSPGNAGTGLPGPERTLPRHDPAAPRFLAIPTHQPDDPIPSKTERRRHAVTQKTTAEMCAGVALYC